MDERTERTPSAVGRWSLAGALMLALAALIRRRRPGEPEDASGSANLEAMEAAHNYHAYLTSTVLPLVDPGRPVLDFGAGTGTHARALREAGHDVCVVELEHDLRDQMAGEGFTTAESLGELAPETFGTVYSFNVLEHIEDDLDALAHLYKVAAPGAHLVLYVPAFQVLFSVMDHRVGHFRRYRRGQLEALVRAAGFRVIGSEYVDSLGFLASLAYRVVANTGRLSAGSIALYDRVVFPVSRALDRLTHRAFGKNLLLVARRD